MSRVRDNWRILLLVVILVASSVALFVPQGDGGAAAASNGTNETAATGGGPTNLDYGLELAGGTRLRAPLVGLTAEGVDVDPQEQRDAQRRIAAELDVSPIDVQVRANANGTDGGTVEVFTENVTRAEFAQALQRAGYQVEESDIRQGVTRETMQTAAEVIERKIQGSAGFAGGGASVVTSADGESFVLVEAPGVNRSQLIDLIGDRGRVEIVAVFPAQGDGGGNATNGTNATNGSAGGDYRRVSLLTQDDLAGVQPVTRDDQGRPVVPVSLEEDAARNFADAMQRFGFTGPGVARCSYDQNPNDPGYCLLTVVDGEVVYSASMGPSLARSIEDGDFVKDPAFQTSARNVSEAQELRLNLEAGALPARLDIDSGTTYFLQPSLAEEFKAFSLVTGLIAWVTVAGVVAYRYRKPSVAVPLILTAAAEVYILLGFAAAVGLALDLSHIAGFIAVIGTGVDDLVIIADEILQRGDVRTTKVFRSRFRRAFWVIGAAAATTIVAMSPLAVLSLGDLQGFAVITIVGVLIGVLITRPAYGDVLRNLVLGE
ncbi:preprotein translocase subunit SecD [Halomarina halobia]|uniref:Protein-export membrane protein SecD n=1 Tax=Halomarina halobia TaxID=3033386 RepID=A0ABD6A8I4_9EURY|nr:preprotein translocase subunit SecD [Halomarina sp. PSR21]